MDILEEKGFFPSDFVISETTWFYNKLLLALEFGRDVARVLLREHTVRGTRNTQVGGLRAQWQWRELA
jgi:hypothetical protein